jgi:hypothetical protein
MGFFTFIGQFSCLVGLVLGGGLYAEYLSRIGVRSRTQHFASWCAILLSIVAVCQVYTVFFDDDPRLIILKSLDEKVCSSSSGYCDAYSSWYQAYPYPSDNK